MLAIRGETPLACHVDSRSADVRCGRAGEFQMTPDAFLDRAGVPNRVCFDDRESFSSSFAIAANTIRIIQSQRRIGRQTHFPASARPFSTIGSRRINPGASTCYAEAFPQVKAYVQSGGRDLRIK